MLPRGYAPKYPDQWNIAIWSDVCVPRNKSNCKSSSTDGFLKYTNMKLPAPLHHGLVRPWTLTNVRSHVLGLKNCSYTAYANLDICDGGSGCLLWFNTLLVDLRNFSELGQDFYIRLPVSELVLHQFFHFAFCLCLWFLCSLFQFDFLLIIVLFYEKGGSR